jgi:acyl-CoA thioesterase
MPLDDLIEMLTLERVEPGRYRATTPNDGGPVVFGGQLLAQTIVAAATVDAEKHVRSIHTVFARSASPSKSLELDVEVVHLGRSVASVSVTASQEGTVCTRSLVHVAAREPDLIRHQVEPTRRCAPADATPLALGDGWEGRACDGVDIDDPSAIGPAELGIWLRVPDAPPGELASQALLAYASYGYFIGTSMRPHAGVGQSPLHVTISTTVLTHTVHFHEPVDLIRWQILE